MSFDQKHLILQNNFQLDFMNAKDKKNLNILIVAWPTICQVKQCIVLNV